MVAYSHLLYLPLVEDGLPVAGEMVARQPDGEGGAGFGGARHVDAAAVRAGDLPGDVQAQSDAPRAVLLRVLGAGPAHERVEDLRELAGRDGRAAVVDDDREVRSVSVEP